MSNTHFATSGQLGVKFSQTETSATHKLGTRVAGSDNTSWVYVQANGAITQYDFVGIDENFQAASLTTAHVDAGYQIGVAQAAFATTEYGWVALQGANLNGRLDASCAADIVLFTTATAGVIDDGSTAGSQIQGIVAVAANTATTAAAKEVLITYAQSLLP